MTRRIEIELTSKIDDTTWTWRAAGARQPKGVLEGSLLPSSAKTGDVLRAEVDSTIDGIEVVAVLPAKEKGSTPQGEFLAILPKADKGPDVVVTYAPKGRGAKGRPRREGGDRPEGRGSRDSSRPPRPASGATGAPERSSRPTTRPGTRPARPGTREGAPSRSDDKRGRDREPQLPTSTVHRNALLATLGPEQLPVAEQLLRGGIPAVRQAIDEQNAAAKASGQPPASSEAITAIADELLPQTMLAAWKDRAAAVQSAGKDVRLRELRAVVTAARTVTLDEEGRTMNKAIRDQLDGRVTVLRDQWVDRMTTALDEGRIVDALHTVVRTPEPGTRCPAELAVRLAEAAGQAMTAETDPTQWLAILAAVSDAPVRRNVKPAGIPADPAVQTAALSAAGLVPELAKLLGIKIPPPPPRKAPARRPVTR